MSGSLPNRTSPRRKDYNYTSSGAYFVTICMAGRQHYFGKVKNGEMKLNDIGKIINKYVVSIPDHFPHVEIHKYVVMPNHIHILLLLSELPVCRDASTARPQYNKNENTASPTLNKPTDTIERTARDAVPTIKPLPTGPKYGSLGYIINQFKSTCTREINKQSLEGILEIPYGDTFTRQPRYHDRIIRNQMEYDRIKYYIQTNPQNRESDIFNQ